MSKYSIAVDSKYVALGTSIRSQHNGWEKTEWQRLFGKYERQMLRRADAFFWSADIFDAVMSSALVLPPDTALSFDRFQHNDTGWWWFEREQSIGGIYCNAIWWAIAPAELGDRDVSVTLYSDRGGSLCATHTLYLHEATTIGRAESDNSRDDLADSVRDKSEFPEGFPDAVRGHKPGEGNEAVRFFVAATLWLEQEIVVAAREQPGRHTRKRLAKEYHDHPTDVLVVRLRRARGNGGSDSVDTEWTCRWIVRGHWRQQYYPSRGERSPIWITPYVKGPDDKPLKPPSERVFAVTR